MMPDLTDTYWSGKGRHQEDYDTLFKQLVPAQGKCETTRGELIRAISKLYYDLYNNGLCNIDTTTLYYLWYVILDSKKEIAEEMGPEGHTHIAEIADAIAHFRKRLRRGTGEGYVGDQFPYVAFELMTDAIIRLVKRQQTA